MKYCAVQTLLNATNARVCASMQDARSALARQRGTSSAERRSCGRKARELKLRVVGGAAEARCRAVA